jgi:phosphomannomutase
MISPDGEPIGEQYSIVLAAEHVLSKNPGAPVVINVQTTKAVNDVAKKYNSPVFLSPVGEINVTSKMLEVGAIIGGEGGSGGVIFPKVHPCRDSFTAAALILEMMAERGQSLPEILAKIPRYCETSAKIPCSGAEAVNILRKLKEHEKYKNLKTITIDGLRFDWDDSWALIRNSNTEPIIRVFVESSTQEKVAHILDEFKNIFNEVKSEI